MESPPRRVHRASDPGWVMVMGARSVLSALQGMVRSSPCRTYRPIRIHSAWLRFRTHSHRDLFSATDGRLCKDPEPRYMCPYPIAGSGDGGPAGPPAVTRRAPLIGDHMSSRRDARSTESASQKTADEIKPHASGEASVPVPGYPNVLAVPRRWTLGGWLDPSPSS